jgi:NTE family protein
MRSPLSPRVGLVLGGGGARGLAHVGVLRVLEAARIPVDLVVGCSMGAMVGTLFAFYGNTSDAEARLKRFTLSSEFKRDQYNDLQTMAPISGADAGLIQTARRFYKLGLFFATTLFKESFLEAAQVNSDIAAIIPEGRIEDARIPLAIVAADLRRAEEVVLRSGSARRAVQASSAIAGVFPPVVIDGRELADGGFVSKVPVEVAFRLGADVVIAVDVSSDAADSSDYGRTGSSLSLRATAIQGDTLKNLQLRFADVVIHPDVTTVHWADFAAIESIIPMGEAAALKALPTVRSALKAGRRKALARFLGFDRKWSVDLRQP